MNMNGVAKTEEVVPADPLVGENKIRQILLAGGHAVEVICRNQTRCPTVVILKHPAGQQEAIPALWATGRILLRTMAVREAAIQVMVKMKRPNQLSGDPATAWPATTRPMLTGGAANLL
jgi:hypothetical protein